MHPKSKAKKEFQRVEFTNIYNIDSDVDPYTFLEDVDMLVTDYSSVFSDFSLLNRPTIIFPFDYKEYSQGMSMYRLMNILKLRKYIHRLS